MTPTPLSSIPSFARALLTFPSRFFWGGSWGRLGFRDCSAHHPNSPLLSGDCHPHRHLKGQPAADLDGKKINLESFQLDLLI